MNSELFNPLETRRGFAKDPHRPQYHFLSPSNFLGDPNGTIFWKGTYHLFYQHNPKGAYDDPTLMHWGHANSEDLVHWTDLPIAIAPTPGGPDGRGCYSGSAVDNNGVPTIIYYGSPSGICIATSDDDLLMWKKYNGNPVIPHPPKGEVEWRLWDPCAWKEGDTWYSLSGGGFEGVRDTAFLFRSKDFVDWEYMHPLYEPGNESDCSVPNFFSLGNKHVLLFASHKRGVQYYIGTYADHKFHPEHHGRMNFGEFTLSSGHLCAGITLEDGEGRRIFFGWITEGRSEEAQRVSGWSGVMSLPRVLSLFDDGRMRMEPAPELETLRRNHRQLSDLHLPADSIVPLEEIRGECMEITADFEPSDARELGVKVRCSTDAAEQTLIVYNRAGNYLELDAEASSQSPQVVGRGVQRGPLDLGPAEPLKLRIFLDRSVVEVFANSRLCLTKRIYPSRTDSLGVELFANSGSARLTSANVWDMASIW